ncbi:hypothetical protein [Streptomyces sp. Root1310]|uniref:MmyB family transcriptional regulator n=1 Tax=Streptomyces sp. Root1310 TaxID=1736452 RepID=UPI000AB6E945|nr:hypothetical protein [Streptomyces sp. Root1310]
MAATRCSGLQVQGGPDFPFYGRQRYAKPRGSVLRAGCNPRSLDPAAPVPSQTPDRLPRSERGREALEAALVADLRTAQGTFPDDPRLRGLIQECTTRSPRFAQLWSQGVAGALGHDRKTVSHPSVGDITLDCDILTVPGSDLRIVAYTAAAGTPSAEQLAFLRVTATRAPLVSHVGNS